MSPPPRHSFVKRSKANNAARRQSRWTAMLHLTVRYASSKPMLATGEHQAALVEIPKQPGRARPSRCEAEDCCDARLQRIWECRDHDRRHRATAPHPQGTVQTGTSERSRPSCTCSLERGALGLKSAQPLNCISIQDILRHDRISSTAGCKYFHYAPLLYESRV